MFSKSIKILLMSAIPLSVSATASAQEAVDFVARMAEVAAVAKQDLPEALRQYLELRVQFSGPEIDYSIGRAYQRMNQCKDAQRYLTEVMVKYNISETTPAYQRAVQDFDKIADCETWQKFYLQCEVPAGGYVMIDDERLPNCWQRPYSLSPGKHTLKVVDANGKSEVTEVTSEVNKPDQHITLAIKRVEKVEVVKRVEVERKVIVREKFHPALYWGLIAGGAAFIAGSGFFSAYANNAYAEEKDYAYQYAVLQDEKKKKKADDAHKNVKMGNTLSYTFAGIGGAAIITGATLGIISAVSEKEYVDAGDINAYAAPTEDGVSLGMHMRF